MDEPASEGSCKMSRYLTVVSLVWVSFLASSLQVHAAAIASGLIISGSTYNTSNAFQFFNNSTSGERIVSITWNLTPIGAFFDTTSSFPGFFSSPLTLGASSPVGHSFPSNASLNGQSVLTIGFTDFDPGEFFRFGVDTDFFSQPDDAGLFGEQFVGATAQAVFSNGSTLQGTYGATTESGFGSRVDINSPVSNPTIPEPSTICMWGLVLGGFALRRRLQRSSQSRVI